jgi:RES domain-containing protein
LRFQGQCYRAHDPKWSAKPLSGEGAAFRGARFNPRGVRALYLSLSIDGAVTEAAQGFGHKLEPLTICMYGVDCEDVVDLRTDAARAAAGVELATMASVWALDLSNGREPASWAVARRFIADGAAGILVPSFASGARPDMTNLVLWEWGPDLPRKVQVYDPSGRLPKDQTSWWVPPS